MLTLCSLLDPAYEEIGPASCVGMTAGWREYTWPPAIALSSSMLVFLLEFVTGRYVDWKYGLSHDATVDCDYESHGTRSGTTDEGAHKYQLSSRRKHSDHDARRDTATAAGGDHLDMENGTDASDSASLLAKKERVAEFAFRQQITAFLILEFGIIFHSTYQEACLGRHETDIFAGVIIGLTLGAAAPDEFSVLYPVIVFHQSFEGLGIGARLSAIPFPRRLRWMPWWLVAGYGLTTPVAIAAGLGVRTTYVSTRSGSPGVDALGIATDDNQNAGSFTANVVSGILDSTSAGILLYTGFVELLARDFLFNPERTNDSKQLTFMLMSVFLGAAIMALLGKWA